MALPGCASDADPAVVMPDAVAVAANARHGCGLTDEGTVRCWGANLYGQLGNGGTDDATAAGDPVLGVDGATSVSAGNDFSCAVIDDGSVRCWGFNLSGQIGDGTNENIAMEAQRVRGLDGATAVAAGGDHACAIVEPGSVECWGGNEFGQLGDGTTEDRLTPSPVPGLRGVAALSAGNGFTCALLADTTVWCWGVNGLGQLGDGGDEDRATPAAVADLDGVTGIASGLIVSCAVVVDGAVRCWGAGDLGSVSEPSERTRRPRTVAGVTGATQVVVGEGSSCAVDDRGGPACWDDGTGGDRGAREPAGGAAASDGPSSIAIWGDELCVVPDDGELTCSRID